MASDERQSTRSPTTSRSDSYRDGTGSRSNDHPYNRRSSITDGNDNEYEDPTNDIDDTPNLRPPQRKEDQYIAALRHRFPNRPRTDYAYSRPIATTISQVPSPSSITTQVPPPPPPPPPASTQTTTGNAGRYQSTTRPATGGTNTSDTNDGRTFLRPALRRVNPDQQNSYARRLSGETTTAPGAITTTTPGATTTTSGSQFRPTTTTTTPGGNVRINDSTIDPNRTTTAIPNRQQGILRTQESTFEKVPLHGGPVSYLGTGTFSQFEHCLRECLERERRQLGYASHIIREDFPTTISAQDYSYESNILHPPITDYHGHYSPTHLTTFSVNDIQHINVAFNRTGIPLFPYSQSYYDSSSSSSYPITTTIQNTYPSKQHISGEVVSACRVVEDDPALKGGSQVVQNVWNAQYHHNSVV